MREILFRGKDIKGNWHIGLLTHIGNAWYISNKAGVSTAFEVIPETVGQYTGTLDNDNGKIFEHDIVKAFKHNEEPFICAITYRNGCFWFGNWNWVEFLNIFRNYEIIGNVFDNPELLKGGVNNG